MNKINTLCCFKVAYCVPKSLGWSYQPVTNDISYYFCYVVSVTSVTNYYYYWHFVALLLSATVPAPRMTSSLGLAEKQVPRGDRVCTATGSKHPQVAGTCWWRKGEREAEQWAGETHIREKEKGGGWGDLLMAVRPEVKTAGQPFLRTSTIISRIFSLPFPFSFFMCKVILEVLSSF